MYVKKVNEVTRKLYIFVTFTSFEFMQDKVIKFERTNKF